MNGNCDIDAATLTSATPEPKERPNFYGQLYFKLFSLLYKQVKFSQAHFLHYLACRRKCIVKGDKAWLFNVSDIAVNTSIQRRRVKALCLGCVKAGFFKPAGNTPKGSPRYIMDKVQFDVFLQGITPLEAVFESGIYKNTCATIAHLPVPPQHRQTDFPVLAQHTKNKDSEKEDVNIQDGPWVLNDCQGTNAENTLSNNETKQLEANNVDRPPAVGLLHPDPHSITYCINNSLGLLKPSASGASKEETAKAMLNLTAQQQEHAREQNRFFSAANERNLKRESYFTETFKNTILLVKESRDASVPVTVKVEAIKQQVKKLQKIGVTSEFVCIRWYPCSIRYTQSSLDLLAEFFTLNPSLCASDLFGPLYYCCVVAGENNNTISGYEKDFYLIKGGTELTMFIKYLEEISQGLQHHYILRGNVQFLPRATRDVAVTAE